MTAQAPDVASPIGAMRAGGNLLAPHVLLIGAAVGLLGTGLPYALKMIALTRLPSRTFGTLMSLEPAVGALMGLALLHQVLSLSQWIAIGAVVTASIGATVTIRVKPGASISVL